MGSRAWIALCAAVALASVDVVNRASSPTVVREAMRAYSAKSKSINERVSKMVGAMTPLEKAKQLDQYFGSQQLLSPNGAINWTAVDYYMAQDASIGVVHDLYDPGMGGSIINQLQAYVQANTTSKVPILFVEECLHGVQQSGKTVFPAPIGSAATFDAKLMMQIGGTIGREARAYGIVQCFSPVIGTAREPRWGRVVETFGEDVHLTRTMALMWVLGAQGGDPSGSSLSMNTSIIAEPKHFVGHSAPQSGANAAPVHMGRRELLESFAPQFEWAVRYGGARGIMAAYHELDGIPSCANDYTLTELLRDEWGFQGWVLADDGAVRMMEVTHNTAASPADALSQFLSAGGNVQYYDYPHEVQEQAIVGALANGTLSPEVLDARVSDLLRVKMELGLFDNPMVDVSLIPLNVDTNSARILALRAAQEVITLLQNNATAAGSILADGGLNTASAATAPILPIDFSKTPNIAVIGPSADVIRDGDYSGTGVASNFVTVLEGIQAAAYTRGGKVTFQQGCQIRSNQDVGVELYPIRHAYLTSEGANGLEGQYWQGAQGLDNTTGAPDFTRLDWDVYFSWYVYGPMAYVRTPFNGVPFYDNTFTTVWSGEITSPVTLSASTLGVDAQGSPFRLSYAGKVVLDTYSSNGTAGPTSFTTPLIAGVPVPIVLQYTRMVGQGITLQWSLIDSEEAGIAAAAEAAASADIAILVIGESDNTVGEGIDSNDLRLPGRQLELVQAVVAAGKPVVVVLLHGRPLAVPELRDSVPAIVSAWFPGQAQGTAIAGALIGTFSPAGRTPMSWPVSVGDLPVFYNIKPSARTGCYYQGCHGVLWPFGHGESYTVFNYSTMVLDPANRTVGPQDFLTINVTVTNVGSMDGDEVPQLYVRDVLSSVTQPIATLRGFDRVFIPAGASRVVSFQLLPERDLYVINRAYDRVVEEGLFTFYVAPSSKAPSPSAVNKGVSGNFSVVTAMGLPWVVEMGSFAPE